MRLMLPFRECYQPVDAARAIERYDSVAGLQQNPGGICPTGGAPWKQRYTSVVEVFWRFARTLEPNPFLTHRRSHLGRSGGVIRHHIIAMQMIWCGTDLYWRRRKGRFDRVGRRYLGRWRVFRADGLRCPLPSWSFVVINLNLRSKLAHSLTVASPVSW